MSRRKLLFLQLMVAVLSIGLWHVLTNYQFFGRHLLDPFFFSTPRDVAAQVI
jgi:NitT/TauT family transport system permease protein